MRDLAIHFGKNSLYVSVTMFMVSPDIVGAGLHPLARPFHLMREEIKRTVVDEIVYKKWGTSS